jgi:hypothetical protein
LLKLLLQLFEFATQLRNLPLVVLRILLLVAALTFNFSLLTSGKLLQLIFSFLLLCGLLLPFTALDGFVLVLVLIQFQFEQIGKIFGALLAAATTAATATALLDLDLGVQCSGFAEVVIRLAFDWNRDRCVVLH